MSTRSWPRAVGGPLAVVALLAAAAVLVVLAADVLRWTHRIDDGDVAYAAGAPLAWEPDTSLPRGLSGALLGVEDDLAYRNAVFQFWRSEPRAPLRQFSDVTRRSAAERVLARTSDKEDESSRRSMLLVLRAALLIEEARNSPTQRQIFVRRAIEQLKRASILDPASEDAVYDLELALKLLRASGEGSGSGGDSRSPLPAPGAGSATSGSGF